MADSDKIWAHRLRQARTAVGISQRQLGIDAGIDEFVASSRINRYEQGVHEPDYLTAQNLAKALGVSAAFFYAAEDDVADMIFRYGQAKASQKQKVRKLLSTHPSHDS
jgi:transcriptional regulator with XRE-family HTH domain